MKVLAALACALVVSAACATSSNVSGDRRNVAAVTVTFTAVPAAVKAGQAVRLTIRLVNNAGTAARLVFPSSQKYDFWITSGRREIWRWSTGRTFTQDITRVEIGGQTGTYFAESWPADRTGTLVAHAELLAETFRGDMKATLTVS